MSTDPTGAPLLNAETSRQPTDDDEAKGTRQRRNDGKRSRENAHRRHRRHCRRETRTAQHVILAKLLQVGNVAAPDFDDLPPVPSGTRTYVGTAVLDFRRAGLIRTVGGPIAFTSGGRHSNYLHRRQLVVDADGVTAWMDRHPVPDDEDSKTDGPADCP
jgi:hypothetical protein